MSVTHDPYSSRAGHVVVDDRYMERPNRVGQVARMLALVAGSIVTLFGLVALARIHWSGAKPDFPMVGVSGMTFVPLSAAITTAIGVILIATAATRFSDGKIAVGAILGTFGVAVLVIDQIRTSWHLTSGEGWLALAVGVVFVLTGLIAEGESSFLRRTSAVDGL